MLIFSIPPRGTSFFIPSSLQNPNFPIACLFHCKTFSCRPLGLGVVFWLFFVLFWFSSVLVLVVGVCLGGVFVCLCFSVVFNMFPV